jgi:sensor histidine kinase YesM
MNPFLKSPRQLLILGLLWSPLCFGVIILHSSLTATPLFHSAVFLVPLLIIELFFCISFWWICKNVPIHESSLFEVILTHSFSATIVTAAWLLLQFLYSRLLESLIKTVKWNSIFIRSLPLMIALGLFLYLISCFFYYLVLAMDRSREAEKSALEQKLHAAEAELKALKATINPHFLFNSLTALNELIKKSPRDAGRMCMSIADFLRHTVRHTETDLITVEEELKHIKNYLEIEKIRLGERLRVQIKREKAAGNLKVPPLILLPLVENAVKHGISQIIEGGRIDISIRKLGAHRLEIEVKNPREEISKRLHGEAKGLETLKRRIAAYYGNDASLLILKNEKSFSARIVLPAL